MLDYHFIFYVSFTFHLHILYACILLFFSQLLIIICHSSCSFFISLQFFELFICVLSDENFHTRKSVFHFGLSVKCSKKFECLSFILMFLNETRHIFNVQFSKTFDTWFVINTHTFIFKIFWGKMFIYRSYDIKWKFSHTA